jgi:uncharacterized membrane protein
MMRDGSGDTVLTVVLLLIALLLVAILVALAVLVLRVRSSSVAGARGPEGRGGGTGGSADPEARRILDRRFASGEIGEDEWRARAVALRGGPS